MGLIDPNDREEFDLGRRRTRQEKLALVYLRVLGDSMGLSDWHPGKLGLDYHVL